MMGYGREATATAMTQVSGAHKPLADDPVPKPRRDFAIEDGRLSKTMPSGELSSALSGALMPYPESPLPPAVANVPKEDVRSFLHHKRVGNYLLGRTLGEGSFAKVKEGMHSLTGEKVAVKVIDKKKARTDNYVSKNMRREARLLQLQHHPNIIQLYEIIETDNSYYLVTELCMGGDLMQHIYKHQYLEEKEVKKYVRQIVSAVDYLHKGNIIHRDLKVENLLLDDKMDIRIIDFGLSNHFEMEQEDGSMEYCSTQCGSPAYAAPELLGHKQYGPEVDIWSIGVNMYAMLTGCLPYTVEPFNITALHAKMLDNKMNAIPDRLSADCRNLLCQLLIPKPEDRIPLREVFQHPWLTSGGMLRFSPHPHPNSTTRDMVNMDIVNHMVHQIRLEDTSQEKVIDCLLASRASATTAIYYMMLSRLTRYERLNKPRRVPLGRMKKSKSYTPGLHTTEADVMAAHVDPGRVPVQRKSKYVGSRYGYGRRASAPVETLEEDLKRVTFDRRPVTKAGNRFPRVPTDPSFQAPIPENSRPVTVSAPRRHVNGMTGGISRKVGEPLPQKHHAWSSKTDSSNDSLFTTEEDIVLGRDTHSPRGIKPHFVIGDDPDSPGSSGLPNIAQSSDHPSTRKKSAQLFPRVGSAKRKTLQAKNGSCEILTHLPLEAIASEVLRVVSNLCPVDLQMKGSTVFCKFPHITVNISLCKDLPNLCQMQFECISKTDRKTYQELCQQVLDELQV